MLRDALAMLLALVSVLGGHTDERSAEVKLQVVKFAEVESAIARQQGKIVVIDVWATWCIPCKQEFHHLVELHKKHEKDGVVCMSVAWDKIADRESALKFL